MVDLNGMLTTITMNGAAHALIVKRDILMQLDSGVVDLLLSRLLHDLIGPVTATVNGIELIEEFGQKANDSIAEEALDLIGTSSRQSADRLSYFRVAFGGAGNSEEHSLATIRRLADAYLGSRKISLEFTSDADDGEKLGAGVAKAILATIFFMVDALPRSGNIHVEIDTKAGGRTTISANGPGALVEEDCIAGLTDDTPPTSLNTRTVIGAVVGHTARRFGIRVDVASELDLARVTLQPTT
jgi:histidine phosphotransferase ChpT